MTAEEIIKYWVDDANENLKTINTLYKAKDYTWSLFIGHLMIEKLLKGLYAKVNKDNPYAPKSHDLVLLAKKCGLEIDENKQNILYTITTFNISARYEDYKNTFRNKCTKEYTAKQLGNIEEMRKWIIKELEMR